MLRFAVRAVLVASVVVSSQALANPVMTETLRLRQVPHTRHVQVTYVRYDSSFDLKSLERDGTAITADWVAGTYNTNMGSGVVNQQSRQTCDCDVALGAHNYEVTNGTTAPIAEAVTVVADAPDPVPADAGNPDAMPWEVPDPVPFQGIDCASICAPATDLDASTGSPDRIPLVLFEDGGTGSKTGGGCSQGLAPLAMGTLAAALFALAGLGMRRRRG